jgi:hypothetical protein
MGLVVVAAHVEAWFAEHGCDVFQVVAGQVAAAKHDVHVRTPLDELGAVDPRDDFIADGQQLDAHRKARDQRLNRLK